MPTIYFVRHAKTIYNKEERFTGRADCDILPESRVTVREKFKDFDKDFDYIYCSPLKRTKQTLDEIIPNSNPIIDERIIEIDLGDWEGVKKDSIDKDLVEAYRQSKYSPPNGEKHEDIKKRVCDFIEELFEKYTDEKILVVTHSGVVRAIKKNFIEKYEKISVKNLDVVIVSQKEYDYYLKNFRDKGC